MGDLRLSAPTGTTDERLLVFIVGDRRWWWCHRICLLCHLRPRRRLVRWCPVPRLPTWRRPWHAEWPPSAAPERWPLLQPPGAWRPLLALWIETRRALPGQPTAGRALGLLGFGSEHKGLIRGHQQADKNHFSRLLHRVLGLGVAVEVRLHCLKGHLLLDVLLLNLHAVTR